MIFATGWFSTAETYAQPARNLTVIDAAWRRYAGRKGFESLGREGFWIFISPEVSLENRVHEKGGI